MLKEREELLEKLATRLKALSIGQEGRETSEWATMM